ncbi:hypothetical protein NKH72_21710 [Mesorhizobium sp. M0955]|uniref:hypothetical protein n=1 Tax=Mesorhizobium sp. M0955 TaxID=2957033 RepID=UPI0033390A0F
MGSSFTCKLNPCCGDRRNCEPPPQYYGDANEEEAEPAAPPAPTSAVDGEIVKALQECIGAMWELFPWPSRKLFEADPSVKVARTALSKAQAAQKSAALAKDTSRFRKLSNVDDDTAPTSAVDGEAVLLKQVINPLFTFYRNCRYKVINRTGYWFLLEDERGNRATVHKSFIVDEAALPKSN